MSNPNRHVKAGGRQWNALKRMKWARDPHVCYLGNHTIDSWEEYDLDHLVPDSLGGLPTDDNTAISCKTHNRQRGNMPLDEWFRRRSHDVEGNDEW